MKPNPEPIASGIGQVELGAEIALRGLDALMAEGELDRGAREQLRALSAPKEPTFSKMAATSDSEGASVEPTGPVSNAAAHAVVQFWRSVTA